MYQIRHSISKIIGPFKSANLNMIFKTRKLKNKNKRTDAVILKKWLLCQSFEAISKK